MFEDFDCGDKAGFGGAGTGMSEVRRDSGGDGDVREEVGEHREHFRLRGSSMVLLGGFGERQRGRSTLERAREEKYRSEFDGK